MKEHKLNETYVLFVHNVKDKDWSKKSYTMLYEFDTIELFWKMIDLIEQYKDTLIHYLCCLMKKRDNEYIYPIWEDAKNVNGGCWSIKYSDFNILDIFIDTCINFIGNTLLKEDTDIVNGVSISPKRGFYIFKIWCNNEDLIKTIHFNDNLKLNIKLLLFRSHKENITKDKMYKKRKTYKKNKY